MFHHHGGLEGPGTEYLDVRGGGKVFRRLMTYWLKHWRYSLIVLVCLTVVGILHAYPALFVRRIVDVAIPSKNGRMLLILSLSVVGVTALSGIFSFFQRYLGEIVAQRVIYRLRKEMYESLQAQSFSFFDRTQTGQLMSRTTMDVDMVRRFLSFGFRMISGSLINFTVVLVVCITVLDAPGLTLLAFCAGPLIVWAMARFSRLMREPLYRSRDAFGSLNSILQENLAGAQVVAAYGQHGHEMDKFRASNERYFDLSILLTRIRAVYSPITSVLSDFSMIAILLYGGYRVASGSLALGTLIAFTVYVVRLTGPLRMLGNMTRIYQDAIAGGRRVFEIIDQKPELVEKPGAVELREVRGSVAFEDVSFSYGEGPPSLEGVSFRAEPGETVVLLGATGSGKSTVVNLIPRFYDPTSGSVKIDGHDLRDVTVKSLRKQIGIVPQETFLFSTTIKENIAYGRPEASMDEIVRCARLAEADEFIRRLPKGYDTVVGERGVTLSGGEKQRVAIARALLMDPRILILDDSTSSVDTETEHEIQKALDTLLRDRTTFIITQRLSMMRKGTKIIVLDQGRVVEQGAHEELLGSKGVYYRIYQAQAGGDLLEAGWRGA